jgi:hypothetical protein
MYRHEIRGLGRDTGAPKLKCLLAMAPKHKGELPHDKPGVYVLYRDDVPYYVGQAIRLRGRMRNHACIPGTRYHNFWNLFSAFVIRDQRRRDEIEGIRIDAMPTKSASARQCLGCGRCCPLRIWPA